MALATVTGSVITSQIVAPATTADTMPISTPRLVTRSSPRSGSSSGSRSDSHVHSCELTEGISLARQSSTRSAHSHFWGQHERVTEQPAERFRDGRVIANHQRRQSCRVQVGGRHPGDLVAGHGVHFRHELLKIRVRQAIECKLGDRPRHLAAVSKFRG